MIHVLPMVLLNSSRKRWYSLGRTKVQGKKSHLDASIRPMSFSRLFRCLLRFFTMRFLRHSWSGNRKDRNVHLNNIKSPFPGPNHWRSLTSYWFWKWFILMWSSTHKWSKLSFIQPRSHQLRSHSSFLPEKRPGCFQNDDVNANVTIGGRTWLTLWLLPNRVFVAKHPVQCLVCYTCIAGIFFHPWRDTAAVLKVEEQSDLHLWVTPVVQGVCREYVGSI